MPAIVNNKYSFEAAADDDLRKMFSDIDYVVEADSFAHQSLWEDWSTEAERHGWGSRGGRRVEWVSDRSGRGWTVGYIDDRTVFISLRRAKVNNVNIIFWHATSVVVDYDMIEKWFKEALPEAGKTDAQNFHCAVNYGETKVEETA